MEVSPVADTVKFGMLRKLLRALGLSEAAVNDLFDWITERLADEQHQSTATAEVTFPYRVRDDFLSPAEHNFYQILRSVIGTRAHICAKVSLADLFYVKSSNASEWRIYTNKIDRKHVDFVLCDPQTMRPLAGVELDDKSHERADRKQRDGFVEGVFTAAGLDLLRVRVQRSYQPQELAALLETVLPSASDETIPIPARFHTTGQEPTDEVPATNDHLNNGQCNQQSNGSSGNGEKSVVISSPACPKCGSEMKLRTAKKGDNQGQQFWGCSNFPRCRAMVAYEPISA
jgi:hypothetical protein